MATFAKPFPPSCRAMKKIKIKSKIIWLVNCDTRYLCERGSCFQNNSKRKPPTEVTWGAKKWMKLLWQKFGKSVFRFVFCEFTLPRKSFSAEIWEINKTRMPFQVSLSTLIQNSSLCGDPENCDFRIFWKTITALRNLKKKSKNLERHFFGARVQKITIYRWIFQEKIGFQKTRILAYFWRKLPYVYLNNPRNIL